MRTLIWVFSLTLVLGLTACDDDDGGTDSGPPAADSGGGDIDSGTGGDTDAGGTDAGGTDAGGTDAGGTDAGGTDAGGTDAGGDGSAEAIAFCGRYETACTFTEDPRYADSAECISEFDAASTDCRDCIDTHLGLVEAMPGNDAYADTHCPHATTTAGAAQGPCQTACQ